MGYHYGPPEEEFKEINEYLHNMQYWTDNIVAINKVDSITVCDECSGGDCEDCDEFNRLINKGNNQ
jgi:hypothetical protein